MSRKGTGWMRLPLVGLGHTLPCNFGLQVSAAGLNMVLRETRTTKGPARGTTYSLEKTYLLNNAF